MNEVTRSSYRWSGDAASEPAFRATLTGAAQTGRGIVDGPDRVL
jgi:hypothetical protein